MSLKPKPGFVATKTDEQREQSAAEMAKGHFDNKEGFASFQH